MTIDRVSARTRTMSTENGKVIWIVNHYAGSRVHGMEYRHYYLAQQFRRMDFRPVILCASFHHLLTRLPEKKAAEVDGVPYVWIKARRYEKNDSRRVINMVEFSARLALRSLRAPRLRWRTGGDAGETGFLRLSRAAGFTSSLY